MYQLQTNMSKEEVLEHFNNILFLLTYLGINNLDLTTDDYAKIDWKDKYIAGPNFDLDYEPIVRKNTIKSQEWTEQYNKELLIYKEYMRRLDDARLFMKDRLTKDFLDGVVQYTMDERMINDLLEYTQSDYSLARKWGNYRLNVALVEWWEDGLGLIFSIRKLKKTPFTLEDMSVTPDILKRFLVPSGLVLISWPTWSAKSSTLVAIMDYINHNRYEKIITLEDPVEFVWKWLEDKATIRQRQVGRSVEDFSKGIKAAVRQHPQIIIIWELRDRESVMEAIEAASTWHLVIATIHVDSVIQVIDRILWFFEWADKGMITTKLSTSLKYVLNQRLFMWMKGKYRVAYEYLDFTASWISQLVKAQNLDDIRAKMYQVDTKWKSYHKPLNISLYEYMLNGELSYTQAKDELSNDQVSFENQLGIYLESYVERTSASREKIQQMLTEVDELYKLKLQKQKESENNQ